MNKLFGCKVLVHGEKGLGASRVAVAVFLAATLLSACQTPRPSERPSTIAPPTAPSLATGTVIFERLEPAQLADFRVIPETGTALFTPENSTYVGVDGFWWRERRGEWFKIPGGTQVRIFPHEGPGSAPAFDLQTTAAADFYIGLKGRVAVPGWHRDAGASAHPTDDPF